MLEILRISGGRRLSGEVRLTAAKNAVLPIMAAALLADGPVTLMDVPHMADIERMGCILQKLGCGVRREAGTLSIDPRTLRGCALDGDPARQLRSSIFLLGPLLSCFGRAEAPYPGGCAIGERPVDLHLSGLSALGAAIDESGGRICVDGRDMRAARFELKFPSVGATENLMMAMAKLPGESRIVNAAREPEVADLAAFLNAMGARIRGAGGGEIAVEGVRRLRGIEYTPIPDRIVGGTLLCAAAVTGGEILLQNAQKAHMAALIDCLGRMGAEASAAQNGLYLRACGALRPVRVKTAPFPGFPTDLQAPVMALACTAQGESRLEETLFENRFWHVSQLRKMGARIQLEGRTARVTGGRLHGAAMEAKDLRCGAALALAALAAEGVSEVSGVEMIDRGYDDFAGMLGSLGADVRRIRRKD